MLQSVSDAKKSVDTKQQQLKWKLGIGIDVKEYCLANFDDLFSITTIVINFKQKYGIVLLFLEGMFI